MRHWFAAIPLVAAFCSAANAQENQPDAIIAQLLETAPQAGQFTPEFLAAVPLDQVTALLESVRAQIGAPVEITAQGAGYAVLTQSHIMDVEIALDAEGRINGLMLHPPLPADAGVAEVAASLAMLPGEVAYLVTREGETLAEKDADTPLAVGSAFKLGILALVAEGIERGDYGWESVIDVGRHSLPTGILQTFLEGSPVTVHTAAALMISMSDNTATDMLIDLVGRQALADKLETDFVLKTREFFFLKGDAAMRARFLAADAAGKLALAGEIAQADMPALDPVMPPLDKGVEWYLSARQLCALLEAVGEIDVMSINPGVARPGDWAQVAHKGGSETGVLNFSTLVTDADGRKSCVVATVNDDAAVDGNAMTGIYGGVLRTLARE